MQQHAIESATENKDGMEWMKQKLQFSYKIINWIAALSSLLITNREVLPMDGANKRK